MILLDHIDEVHLKGTISIWGVADKFFTNLLPKCFDKSGSNHVDERKREPTTCANLAKISVVICVNILP